MRCRMNALRSEDSIMSLQDEIAKEAEAAGEGGL
jgi:hypothetical protein